MLLLAVVRTHEHSETEPDILFELDLKSALKDHVAQGKFRKRALRLIDDAFTAAEDNLKHQTTTL